MEEMRPNQRASRHYGGLYSYGFRCCSDDEVRRLHRLARRRRGGAAKHLEVAHERAEGSVVVEQLERGLHGEGVGKGVCRRRRGCKTDFIWATKTSRSKVFDVYIELKIIIT